MTIRLCVSIILAFLLCACSDQNASAPVAKSGKVPHTPIQAPPREPSKRELVELAKSENLVTRKDKTLRFQLLSGKSVELTDLVPCEDFDNCVIYEYEGLIADKQLFLITTVLYESFGALVISRKTGEDYWIFDRPHISPDGKFLVTAFSTDNADSGLHLWEISDGRLTPRFKMENDQFSFTRWVGSDKVELMKRESSNSANAVCSVKDVPVHLVAYKDEWKLEESSEKDKAVCVQ
jgi:hypothetical protein